MCIEFRVYTNNLIYHGTHRDWHLCNGLNSDWLEVLPLCKGIRWLGYGSPDVNEKKGRGKGASHYAASTTGNRHRIEEKHCAYRKKNWFSAQPVHRQLTLKTWSLTQHIFWARFFGMFISNVTHTTLLCSDCHLSKDNTVLVCAVDFASHRVFMVCRGVAKDDLHLHLSFKRGWIILYRLSKFRNGSELNNRRNEQQLCFHRPPKVSTYKNYSEQFR